jgi:hypothetical protein
VDLAFSRWRGIRPVKPAAGLYAPMRSSAAGTPPAEAGCLELSEAMHASSITTISLFTLRRLAAAKRSIWPFSEAGRRSVVVTASIFHPSLGATMAPCDGLTIGVIMTSRHFFWAALP